MSADWFTDADAAHDPEALERALARFDATDWSAPEQANPAGVQAAFDGVQAYAWSGRAQGLVAALATVAELVGRCLAKDPSAVWPLEALINVHHLEGNFEQFDPSSVPALERWGVLLAAAPGRGDLAEALTAAQSVLTYTTWQQWQRAGGHAAKLPAEQQALAERLAARWPELLSEAEATSGDAEKRIRLARALGLHFASLQSATESLAWRERLIGLLVQHPGRTAEQADAHFEAGQTALSLNAWAAAEQHFVQAHDLYASLGEAYDIHRDQTESWIEACHAQQRLG